MEGSPSCGWRGVYRSCGVSPELEPEVIGRGFDPPDSMENAEFHKDVAQIVSRLVRSDDRRETFLAFAVIIGVWLAPAMYRHAREQKEREKPGPVRFKKIE